MRLLTPLFAVLAMTAAIGGCRAKRTAGAACQNPGHFVCAEDGVTALYCRDTRYEAIPCRGKNGCTGQATSRLCDDSVAQMGEACMSGFACTESGREALECSAGRWRAWRACGGEKRCAIQEDDSIACDHTIGDVGDACGERGTAACSKDGTQLLVCVDDKLAPTAVCRGGCRVLEDAGAPTIRCDQAPR